MRRATTTSHTPRAVRLAGLWRSWLRVALAAGRCCAVALWLAGLGVAAHDAHAQGVELAALELKPSEGELTLEFSARLTLSRALEDALRRGVPMYFEVEATLYRSRWYWRDERVSRVSRSYRLSYQPLIGSWRVGLGALGQTYPTLTDALDVISRVGGWRLADAGQLYPDQRYYVEFGYGLDSSQLPQPLQIGVGNDWSLGITRVLRVDNRVIEAVKK
jgi:hypothetical protein